jgi:hypothetical protein
MSLREPLHLESLAGLDPDAPVTMLNLMKFRARSLDGNGSGWDAYLRYSAQTAPLFKARGGTIVWAGDVKTVALGALAEGDWDYAALVWYPRPAAFVDMMTSRRRQRAPRERHGASPDPGVARDLHEAARAMGGADEDLTGRAGATGPPSRTNTVP